MQPDVLTRVKAQYERFPYPYFSLFAKTDPVSACHTAYETGAALTHHVLASHCAKTIGLFGAGTYEPYVQGNLHPLAQIEAVDLSSRSLRRAKLHCVLKGVRNVKFINQDLVTFSEQNKERFDMIHCFGVLHHLPEPLKGFVAIKEALKASGFCRIMVYSQQRRPMQLIQQAARLLGITPQTPHAQDLVKDLIECLPQDNILRLSAQLNRDLDFKSGIIDACLHEHDRSFSLEELNALLKQAGLFIHHWDFSSTLLQLLRSAPGSDLDSKMGYLEALNQWPSSFTFWAAPFKPKPTLALSLRTNPCLRGHIKRKMQSTLLRKSIELDDVDLIILRQGLQQFLPPISLKNSRVDDLKAARFLLEVTP